MAKVKFKLTVANEKGPSLAKLQPVPKATNACSESRVAKMKKVAVKKVWMMKV